MVSAHGRLRRRPHLRQIEEVRERRAPARQRASSADRSAPCARSRRVGSRPRGVRVDGVEHQPVGETREIVERLDRSAAPPDERRQAGQPQRGDGVVEITAAPDPRSRSRSRSRARSARYARPRRSGWPARRPLRRAARARRRRPTSRVGFADDDDGRGQGARRPALAAAAVADEARQRDFDLGRTARRARPAAGLRRRSAGATHSVLQRRPSAAIMASASRGPHSPAS